MSLCENVRPLLAARAATHPNAARLLEMFTKDLDQLPARVALKVPLAELEESRENVPSRGE